MDYKWERVTGCIVICIIAICAASVFIFADFDGENARMYKECVRYHQPSQCKDVLK